MRTGAVMGWFTANIGYHHIHHLNAKIPFYRLPEVIRRDARAEQPQGHVAKPGGHLPVPPAEGVGRAGPGHGLADRGLRLTP